MTTFEVDSASSGSGSHESICILVMLSSTFKFRKSSDACSELSSCEVLRYISLRQNLVAAGLPYINMSKASIIVTSGKSKLPSPSSDASGSMYISNDSSRHSA